MSDIRFACPYCSQHIACDEDYADLAIDCPACGNSMVVPRLSAANSAHPDLLLLASPPAPKHVPAPPVQTVRAWTEREWAERSESSKGTRKEYSSLHSFARVVLWFVLIVMGMSAVAVGVLFIGCAAMLAQMH